MNVWERMTEIGKRFGVQITETHDHFNDMGELRVWTAIGRCKVYDVTFWTVEGISETLDKIEQDLTNV